MRRKVKGEKKDRKNKKFWEELIAYVPLKLHESHIILHILLPPG
jgi:hypothetical protein